MTEKICDENNTIPEIVAVISEGDRTEVYLASDKTEEPVIYKIIRGKDSSALCQRIQECKSPFFPHIKRFWYADGAMHVVEEFLEGRELSEMLTGSLSESEGLNLIRQLTEAVKCMHSMDPPLIHRDIKPQNILVTPQGELKLIDFDAAREYTDEDKDRDTVLLGTRGYAAPEQFGYNQTDIRSDVYSVGIVCNGILDRTELGERKRRKLRPVFSKATMFDPDERYDNVGKMQAAFDKAVNSGKRTMTVCAIACLSAVVLFGGFFVFAKTRNRQQPATLVPKEITCFNLQVMPKEYRNNRLYDKVAAVYNDTLIKRFLSQEIPYDTEGADGLSNGTETVLGSDLPVFRYLRAYPQAWIVSEPQLEDDSIARVTLTRYTKNGQQTLDKYDMEYGNEYSLKNSLFMIQTAALDKLLPGLYRIEILTEKGLKNEICLICHGEEEKVDNFAVRMTEPVQIYFISEKNSVFYYVYNTPYGIESIYFNDEAVPESYFSRTADNRGFVLRDDFVYTYKDKTVIEIKVVMENGRCAYGRLIVIP